jgi:hypothetical protein
MAKHRPVHGGVYVPVGPYQFKVVMVDGPLYNEDGCQCLTTIDWERHRLLISTEVPPAYRALVGAAAAAEAWQRVTTPPAGDAA